MTQFEIKYKSGGHSFKSKDFDSFGTTRRLYSLSRFFESMVFNWFNLDIANKMVAKYTLFLLRPHIDLILGIVRDGLTKDTT